MTRLGVGGGLTSLDGSLFNGTLQSFAGGQTLTGAYRGPSPPVTPGAITLAFNDARSGTLSWPGGTIPIERFAIAPTGGAPPRSFTPESGWWWSTTESGRGYFMEFANGQTLTGAYRPAAAINDRVGTVGIKFQSSSLATLTLPDGRQVSISRFAF